MIRISRHYVLKAVNTADRILHEKREKAWRDRELERVVKPEPDNSVIAARILQILYGRGIVAI